MDIFDKLEILADAAKYDASCSSSGVDRVTESDGVGIGSACAAGICHSFAADGRCISLLKVLQSNACVYDCAYCVNRRSHDHPRATFTPRELADLTIQFYRRNYIEGLFLSSAVVKNADYTCEQLLETMRILRKEYFFRGYIHVKAIPGADPLLTHRLGLLADRMSVNIELPSEQSLLRLAPDKTKQSILQPMKQISGEIQQSSHELVRYRHAERFAPAGQSTQMIIGATADTDFQIMKLSEGLYRKYQLKRVYFSAYIPMMEHPNLPVREGFEPPLLREHRLYQADWLMRFYGFHADELLDEAHPQFHPLIDPKANWAINHPELFPIEVNQAPYEMLLRVPGIGVKSAQRIRTARREQSLSFEGLKKLGVVLKRAQYFITCNGKLTDGVSIREDTVLRAMVSAQGLSVVGKQLPQQYEQLSLFGSKRLDLEEVQRCARLTGN